MMQQWFSQREVSPAPDVIILATQPLVDRFQRRVKMLTYEQLRNELIERQQCVLESIIQSLQFDNKIEMEIMCGTMDMVRHDFNIHDREDVDVVATAVRELAEGVYGELQRLNAYQNGYLFYQYHSLEGRDIVMIRLQMDETESKGQHGRRMRRHW